MEVAVKRLVRCAFVLLLAGCPYGTPCTVDADCNGNGVCDGRFCYEYRDSGSVGGGTAGGMGVGGGAGGGSVGGGSVGGGGANTIPTSLVFTSPDAGARSGATTMGLTVKTLPAGSDVVSVDYRATLSDGGSPKTGSFTSAGSNTYSASLTALADGEWNVTATAGSLDASVSFVVDTRGPVLAVEALTPPNYGAASADFIPVEPDGGVAFRKDETVQVHVTSADTDVASVSLSAQFGSSAAQMLTASTSCGAGCWEFTLDLSTVAMPAFSGDIVLTPAGTDTLGHAATATAGHIRVTRWQWAKRLGQVAVVGSLRSTPAVGSGGRVFLGLSNGTNTGIVAVEADGGQAWTPLADAPVLGLIALARGTGNETLLYVAAGLAKQVSAGSGVPAGNCPTVPGTGTTEGGVTVFGDGTANVGGISLQPADGGNRSQYSLVQVGSCRESLGGLTGVPAPGNMVSTNSNVFFTDSDGNLKSLDVVPGTSIGQTGLTQSVGGIGVVNGLALLSGNRIAGGGGGGPGIGKLFAFDITGNTASNAWSASTTPATPTSGPSVGAGGVFAQVRVSGGSQLLRANSTTGVVSAQTTSLSANGVASEFSGAGVSTPVLGNGGMTYAVDQKGSMFVVPQNFAAASNALWAAALPSAVAGTVTASPTLDCNRRKPSSQTGVLYLATESGWLVSYLVDSPGGLDTTAPWPKYARDARNTGNFNGPAIGCP